MMLKLEAKGLLRITCTTASVEQFRKVCQELLNSYAHKTRTLKNGGGTVHIMLEVEESEFQIGAVPGPRPYHYQQFVIVRKPRKQYTRRVKPELAKKIIDGVVAAIT